MLVQYSSICLNNNSIRHHTFFKKMIAMNIYVMGDTPTPVHGNTIWVPDQKSTQKIMFKSTNDRGSGET